MHRLTPEDVDSRLIGRSIQRLGAVNSATARLNWRCTICSCVWSATPNNVLNRGSGCPSCNKPVLTLCGVNEKLKDRQLKVLQLGQTASSKITCECLECGYQWTAQQRNVLYTSSKCKRCCHRAPLTDEVVDSRISHKPIVRMESVVGGSEKIKWQCTNCSHVWSATPNNVMRKTGCPICARHEAGGGYSDEYFNENPERRRREAWLYIAVLSTREDGEFVKVGITTDVNQRFALLKHQGVAVESYKTFEMSLYEAYRTEQEVLSTLKPYKFKPSVRFGGHTECFRSPSR